MINGNADNCPVVHVIVSELPVRLKPDCSAKVQELPEEMVAPLHVFAMAPKGGDGMRHTFGDIVGCADRLPLVHSIVRLPDTSVHPLS
jgi:hypothetical protein